jgi:hypothetical protein
VKQPGQVPAPWLEEVTTTSFAPALTEAGVVPVIWVALTTARLSSSLPPTVTLVTLVKLVPVIVTLVSPVSGPLAGATSVTVTAGGGGFGSPLSPQPIATRPKARRHTEYFCEGGINRE